MATQQGESNGQKYAHGAVSLYIVCDTTGSMSQYIESLRTTLAQVLAVSRVVFGDAAKIHLISYKDYCDSEVVSTCSGTPEELQEFASKLEPDGGGDWPEAAKTALNRVLEMVDSDAQTFQNTPPPQPIVFLYTDAPPHHKLFHESANFEKEKAALSSKSPAGFDWMNICRVFRDRSIPVYSFLVQNDDDELKNLARGKYIYGFLGSIIALNQTQADLITRATMGVELALFGQPLDDTSHIRHLALPPAATSAVFGPDGTSLLPNESSEFLQEFSSENTLEDLGFEFPAVPGLAELLKVLPGRFSKEEAFQDVVFEVLQHMFTKDNVIALTYNGVIGTLWRLCCRRKNDERLPRLRDQLGGCVQSLREADRKTLQDWLEQSYDQTEEIEEAIHAAEKLAASGEGEAGVLVMEGNGEWAPSREELMSIARSPLPSTLASAQRLLTQVMVVDKAGGGVGYLPLALSDEELFATLPHLVCSGTRFTRRPATIMAILAFLSGNACLKERAARFLGAIRGQWIPLDNIENFPEVMSAAFVRLLSLGVEEFLTEKEIEIYKRAHVIQRLRLAAPKEFSMRVPFNPKKDQVWADDKAECLKCHHVRSFTILQDGICGICLGAEANDPPPPPDYPDCSPTQSHLVQCKMCTAIYAVSRPDDLKCQPKCYYCRILHQTPPTVTCSVCLNKFVHPTSPTPPTFTCAVCRGLDPQAAISTLQVPFLKLLQANQQLLLAIFNFPASTMDTIFNPSGGSLFKLYTQHANLFTDPAADPETTRQHGMEALRWEGKVVHEVEKLMESVRAEVLTGSLSGTCYLCFDEKALVGLESACGRCPNKACAACLGTWYGQVRPGALVLRTHLSCAFCKRVPVALTLKRHNKPACMLVRGSVGTGSQHARTDMYYAWCIKCYLVKELMPRECASGELPTVKDFACEECQMAAPQGTKPCPGCSAQTVKAGGCNHITCPCGTHWCYECGEGFPEDEIYDHMYHAHGGLGVEGE